MRKLKEILLFLIKSIAEQGYSLETALADLMDNSVTANATRIEVLTKVDTEPFILFIADNGDGMDKALWMWKNRKEKNPISCIFLLSDGQDDYIGAENRVADSIKSYDI